MLYRADHLIKPIQCKRDWTTVTFICNHAMFVNIAPIPSNFLSHFDNASIKAGYAFGIRGAHSCSGRVLALRLLTGKLLPAGIGSAMNKTYGIRFTFGCGTNCDAIGQQANHL